MKITGNYEKFMKFFFDTPRFYSKIYEMLGRAFVFSISLWVGLTPNNGSTIKTSQIEAPRITKYFSEIFYRPPEKIEKISRRSK